MTPKPTAEPESGREVGDWIDAHLAEVAREWPDLDMEVEALVTRLSKIHRYLERILGDTARDHGISHGEFKVLVTLKGAGKQASTPGELSDKLLVSSGAMTNRLDGLESAGLIRRDPDPADRRGVLVSLTPEGDELIERAVYQQARKEQEALAVLDAREKAALDMLLRQVTGFLLERYGPPRKRPHDEPPVRPGE